MNELKGKSVIEEIIPFQREINIKLENISLKNRIQDISRILPVYQEQLTEICELKGIIADLKDKYKEDVKVLTKEINTIKRERNAFAKALREKK